MRAGEISLFPFGLTKTGKGFKFKIQSICSYGKWTEKLCPDGMVFNDYSSDQEKCDLPYNLDCSKRPKLREFISSC